MFSYDLSMIFNDFCDFQAFQVISECLRMIPERPRPIPERFGAVEAPKSQIFSKMFADKQKNDRKIICWESSETDFGEVSGGLELI